MKRVEQLLRVLFFLSFLMIPLSLSYAHFESQDQEEVSAILVGRISYIEGQLSRYVTEEEDWVATVKDAPFGVDDVLYSSFDGKAEIIMPRERINKHTNSITTFTNFPTGTHSTYTISSFFWILSLLIIVITNLILLLSP